MVEIGKTQLGLQSYLEVATTLERLKEASAELQADGVLRASDDSVFRQYDSLLKR